MAEITEDRVLDVLNEAIDPDHEGGAIGVRNVRIDGGEVALTLVFTDHTGKVKAQVADKAEKAIAAIDGVTKATIETTAETPPPEHAAHAEGGGADACGHDHSHGHGGGHGQGGGKKELPPREPIPGVKHTIAVASGKGGVGKSTVSVNLALALSKDGSKVGLLDVDVYGPSIPMMMGVHEPLKTTADEKIIPIESHGVKLISVGFMLDEEQPLIWRGPLVMQLVQQFLRGVEWGELDYLVMDLPPGTGDAQLTLVQSIPVSGVVIVTTPQDVALIDARRALKMFHEVDVPILGIVENMSHFVCPHCNETTDIFSSGGGEKTSKRYDVPFLGSIPLDPVIRECGDDGKPVVDAEPDSPHSAAFREVAGHVRDKVEALEANPTAGTLPVFPQEP